MLMSQPIFRCINDSEANLYDIEVTFVTEAYGIGTFGSKVAYSVLSRSYESDTVTKRRPVHMHVDACYLHA